MCSQQGTSLPPRVNASNSGTDISSKFLEIEDCLCNELSTIAFTDPICYVYNPLIYARSTHEFYVKRYLKTSKSILFLGMNPGPFGMVQNGVPFGECNVVKDWLKIEGHVGKPAQEHPNRPILGLDCSRSEVSGRRFWGFIQEHSLEPDSFFEHIFVHNYCPLSFLSKSGKNLTPPEIKAETRNRLIKICDEYLCQIIKLLGVHTVIGIGKFAAHRTEVALKDRGLIGVKACAILHPSPANPAANKGWDQIVKKQLEDLDLMKYFAGNS